MSNPLYLFPLLLTRPDNLRQEDITVFDLHLHLRGMYDEEVDQWVADGYVVIEVLELALHLLIRVLKGSAQCLSGQTQHARMWLNLSGAFLRGTC